ncbi:MAG: acyl-CoA dehydratase activase-related protein [Coriobacteriales bacterium]|jgi:predicted nucleotide-binding protein (sugar kinase/HSP70/actin superfamily)|nr:acyl-CoA dehydratase activase-related protein [Coriobacteriales bacterium]
MQPTIDLFEWTLQRLFDWPTLRPEQAERGIIGIPRVLNFYHDYPLWHTLLTELGFSVVLSAASSRQMYLKAAQTILSESACYPAKLVNAHILDLLQRGVENVFFPTFEYTNDERLNCSLLSNWPLTLKLNARLRPPKLIAPYIANPAELAAQCQAALADFGVSAGEVTSALEAARQVQADFYRQVREEGAEAVAALRQSGGRGVVVAGRPYHLDPEINHGLPDVLRSFGLSVLTPESIIGLGSAEPGLYVENHWQYPALVYRAAQIAAEQPELEFLQTYSFGCGHDALTCDQARKIVESAGGLYTSLKIDEMSDLAATRIRMRSMLAALDKQRRPASLPPRPIWPECYDPTHYDRVVVANVYLPESEALAASFANAEVACTDGEDAILTGLARINNDACYCAIYLVGQILDYLSAGMPGLQGQGQEESQGQPRQGQEEEQLPQRLLVVLPLYCVKCRALDLRAIMQEAVGPGVDVAYAHEVMRFMDAESAAQFASSLVKADVARHRTNADCANQLGVVGNGPIVFNETINHGLLCEIAAEGCQPICPNYTDYLLYHGVPGSVAAALEQERANHPEVFRSLEDYRAASEDFGVGADYQNGCGWLYAGQVLDLSAKKVHNIIYAHSFGCLPAHTIGRGIINKLRNQEATNLVSIEFDPGSSRVNQSNRIRLLASIVKSQPERMEEQQ